MGMNHGLRLMGNILRPAGSSARPSSLRKQSSRGFHSRTESLFENGPLGLAGASAGASPSHAAYIGDDAQSGANPGAAHPGAASQTTRPPLPPQGSFAAASEAPQQQPQWVHVRPPPRPVVKDPVVLASATSASSPQGLAVDDGGDLTTKRQQLASWEPRSCSANDSIRSDSMQSAYSRRDSFGGASAASTRFESPGSGNEATFIPYEARGDAMQTPRFATQEDRGVDRQPVGHLTADNAAACDAQPLQGGLLTRRHSFGRGSSDSRDGKSLSFSLPSVDEGDASEPEMQSTAEGAIRSAALASPQLSTHAPQDSWQAQQQQQQHIPALHPQQRQAGDPAAGNKPAWLSKLKQFRQQQGPRRRASEGGSSKSGMTAAADAIAAANELLSSPLWAAPPPASAPAGGRHHSPQAHQEARQAHSPSNGSDAAVSSPHVEEAPQQGSSGQQRHSEACKSSEAPMIARCGLYQHAYLQRTFR